MEFTRNEFELIPDSEVDKTQDFPNSYLFERLFWKKAIPLLSSGNKMVESVIRAGARVFPLVQQSNLPLKALFWACIGLSLGLGIGVLIA